MMVVVVVRLKGTPRKDDKVKGDTNTDASWPDNVRILYLQAMYGGSVNIYAREVP